MIIETKAKRSVALGFLATTDFDQLANYLQQLSPETKKRFGPHPFDKDSIATFYNSSDTYQGYIARDLETGGIIAYSIVKMGYLEHDGYRLQSYGITPDSTTDCTFAPSVADSWQGMGIGNQLLRFIIADVKTKGIRRVILWGGVQMDNEKALTYYLQNGFRRLGQFSHNGENYDMVLDIS